ncbi:MAG TPA: neutral/alkaline non-lysosomal ceramidase N-terminal domain-containing protein [Blastocatellia bacterium]
MSNKAPRILTAFVFTMMAFAATANAQTPAPVFKVGEARRDVTPREPLPMWGYGARHAALSVGTLDPLYAEALVIQAGDKKLAIVGLDLGRSPAEASLQRIRERIKSEAGINYSFIAGSHTHHGPVLELTDEPGKGRGRFDAALRYYREMEDSIVAAIVEADSKLAPAKMAVGSVQLEGFNRNRHSKQPVKPSDRDLAVIRFDGANGKPIAILVNFAAHPTMVSGATLRFSADYVGAMKAEVEKATGARVIFMQGAAGDQSVNGQQRDYRAFGQALANEVVKVAAGLTPQEVSSPSLEVKEDRFKFSSRIDLNNSLTRSLYEKAFFPELIPNYVDEYADGVRPRLTVAVLNGEIAMVGVSGEFFSAHSIRLKERARVKQLFFFGYCNGYHQYFPTIEAVAEGGYGADNRVAPAAVGAGEQIMNTALMWIYQLTGKIK